MKHVYKLTNVTVGRWKCDVPGKCYRRRVEFDRPLPFTLPLLPSVPHSIVDDVVYFSSTEPCMVYENCVQVPNMPQGEKFTAHGQLRFEPEGVEGQRSSVQLTFETRFHRSTIMRPLIGAAAYQVVASQRPRMLAFLAGFVQTWQSRHRYMRSGKRQLPRALKKR